MIEAPVLVGRDIGREILTHILRALDGETVEREPFTHRPLRELFPEDVYAAMLAHLPHVSHYLPDNPKKYGRAAAQLRAAGETGLADPQSVRYQLPLSDTCLAGLPEPERTLWSGVARALTSDELKGRFFDLFADDLCRRFRTNRAGLARVPAFPRPTLVRDLSGYWLEPHPDSRAKIVTVQCYLARDDGQRALGTALYRRHLFDPRNLLSSRHLFEKVRQMDFLPNSGYAFPVGRHTWHGREEVPGALGERHSILLFYFRDPSRW